MSTVNTSHVSLQDSDADRDELEIIRSWMMRDEPAADECPTLDEPFTPDPEDAAWWATLSRALEPLDFDLWMDEDREAAPPELSDDWPGAFGAGGVDALG